MDAYFDTNVYSYVAATGEIAQTREWLADHRFRLVASELNIFEIYAISSRSDRERELRVLTALAKQYDPYPMSWRQAIEVRQEVGRCHPEWLDRAPRTRQMRELLNAHKRHWSTARSGDLPDAAAYAAFRRDFEAGVQQQRQAQREARQLRLKDASQLVLTDLRQPAAEHTINLDDPEDYWRLDCFWAWYNALVKKNPASRDYADWLEPFIKPGSFNSPEYAGFWFREVRPEYVALNRPSGLLSYYQVGQKVEHGNAVDQSHSAYFLRCQLFVTCDRRFASALTSCATHFEQPGAKLRFLERARDSVVGQLESE
jgi:hypothetical protein